MLPSHTSTRQDTYIVSQRLHISGCYLACKQIERSVAVCSCDIGHQEHDKYDKEMGRQMNIYKYRKLVESSCM